MNRTFLVFVSVLVIIASAFTLAGCGGDGQTISDYISKHPEIQEQINKSLASMESEDMSLDVQYDKNTVIIQGNLKQTYDEDMKKALRESIEDGEGVSGKAFEDTIAQIEQYSQIPGVEIKLVINNGDGSALWEKTYN